MKFIEWELENDPHCYDKPRCGEFIDRQTLTHVVCNVDRPEDVSVEAFAKTLTAVAETLDLFPYLPLPKAHALHCRLKMPLPLGNR